MTIWIDLIEGKLAELFSNIKLVEKALLGIEGSYVELLTILALGLLAIIPIFVPKKRRQFWRHLNQIFGIEIFILILSIKWQGIPSHGRSFL